MFTKLKSNKGVALITAYIVIASLITLSAGFALSSVTELNNAKRYNNSTKAFWLAESAVNEFIHNTDMLGAGSTTTLTIGGYPVVLTKDDSNPNRRLVTATATIGSSQRSIQIEFPALPPNIFNHTIASGGNFTAVGASWRYSNLNVHDETRLHGTFQNSAFHLNANFEDKLENQLVANTKLTYPDMNGNSVPDEFADFVEYNRDIAASYPTSEVIYVTPANGETVVVYPHAEVEDEPVTGKKILYVEGSAPGQGDVEIWFDANGWNDNEDLTIISTGTVSYVEPLDGVANNSHLNVIAWENYNQGSILVARHSGSLYSHGTANFTEILSSSETEGNLIANNGISFTEWLQTTKDFQYVSPIVNGEVPAGFEGLVGGAAPGYSSTPNSWKEI
ncbi:MAG: hypothetical protein WC676_06740 [Candidatus Omnitrophota bacterium]